MLLPSYLFIQGETIKAVMADFKGQLNDDLLLALSEKPEFVPTSAVIATYDDVRSTPHIQTIELQEAGQYIEAIAERVYTQAQQLGGILPYTIIRELAENLIHAHFCEPVISIFDKGNTIRFTDQGPGIQNKERVREPGITSATEEMKSFIRGVGSGLTLVNEYLEVSNGSLTIEDNINTGCVITISVAQRKPTTTVQVAPAPLDINLTANETIILRQLFPDNILGVTDVRNATGLANSSIYKAFNDLEQRGLVLKTGKKRALTSIGRQLFQTL